MLLLRFCFLSLLIITNCNACEKCTNASDFNMIYASAQNDNIQEKNIMHDFYKQCEKENNDILDKLVSKMNLNTVNEHNKHIALQYMQNNN